MARLPVTWKELERGLSLSTGEAHILVLAGAWVGIELVDQTGAPMAGAAYRILQDNAEVATGALNEEGRAKLPGLDPGPCEVSFPEFHTAEWLPDPTPVTDGQTHTVEPGEHMAAIADRYGFRGLAAIWDHPNNAELKQQRKTPHVLQAGDQVFIPQRTEGKASCATGDFHRFVLKGEPVKLRIKLLSSAGAPLAGQSCVLSVDGTDTEVITDDSGILELVIPPATQSATLAAGDSRYDLNVGGLDPIDTTGGQHARLRNLGYDLDAAEGDCDVDADQLRFAIELFQHDQGLPITGEADDATKALLAELAGC
jgi:hypothetical protein